MNDYLKKTTLHDSDVPKGVQNYLRNMRIVSLLAIALIVGGFISYKNLPQTVAPEINLTLLVVSAGLPGATPEDVEKLLTIPLENELQSVKGTDSVESSAQSGFTSVVMTFNRGVTKDRALADVEAALSRVGELPDDATEPRVEAVDFEDAPIVQWNFATSSTSTVSLSTKMQKLIDLLEANQKIDRVVTGGQPTQEIQVLITPEAFSEYDVSISDIRSAVLNGIATLPSGTAKGAQVERSISIEASVDDINALRALPITIGSGAAAQIIALGDLATIIERPETGTNNAYLNDGNDTSRVVSMNVFRASGVDLSDAVKSAQSITQEFMQSTGEGITQYEIYNADADLSGQFNELMRNLATTVALVFITLTLFVGRRQALLAAMSIPLVYAFAFIAMQFTGVSVNFLSLFSLTLSLGLLVDVTIVIVSAMTTYMREGTFGAHKTGILVFRDFFVTLIMTTLTTVWAFVPLLLAGGIIGEYIKPIPVIVSSVLIASVFVGFFVILPLMIWLFNFSLPNRVLIFIRVIVFAAIFVIFMTQLGLETKIGAPLALVGAVAFVALLAAGRHLLQRLEKARKARAVAKGEESAVRDIPRTIIDVSKLQAHYRNALEHILGSKVARWKTIAMVAIFFVFACSLIPAGYVKNLFFPGGDNNYLFVAVELPDGTTAEATEDSTRHLLPAMSSLPGVDYVTMQVGFDASGDEGSSRSSDNNVLFTLKSDRPAAELEGANDIRKHLEVLPELQQLSAGEYSIVEIAGGPPAGADITVTFVGEELAVLRGLARDFAAELGTFDGKHAVQNIDISPGTAAAVIAFEPNDYTLEKEGVSRSDISTMLRLSTAGVTLADDVEFAGLSDKRDITLRMSSGDATLADIGRLQVVNRSGEYLPLDTLGSITLKENITEIERSEFERTVTVTAAVAEGVNAGDVNTKIADLIDKEMQLPAGYAWRTGGANEENNESVVSIVQGMGLAAVLIFLTLIIHLRSYRKAAIVLMTVPLAFSGVFVIFGITGIPLSFPSLIGLLALFGIVVNNAIIIISQINANREVGLSFHDAVISGASSRLEPILLSSLTTIIGLLPITLSDPIWQGLGGAIIAGLTFSGLIMLFFIPTLYYIIMKDEDPERIT